jgi:hypothetical protein
VHGLQKMTRVEMQDWALSILDYLTYLPEGTEISTSEAVQQMHEKYINLPNLDGDSGHWITIDSIIWENAHLYGLFLDDSKYHNQYVGLPYNIPYIIRHQTPSL